MAFRHHDDVAGVQRDIAFQVLSGLIGAIVEHEDVFAGRAASPHHDAPFGGKGTKTARERNGLHQRGFLANDIRAWPHDFAGDEDLRFQVFVRDIFDRQQRNRDVQALVLVVVPQLLFEDIFHAPGGLVR